MVKTITANKQWSPLTAKVFVPSRLQYAEAGIDWRLTNKDTIKIRSEGYRAPSEEEENRLLAFMKIDPMCGFCLLGNQEVPAAAREEAAKNVKLQHENDQMKAEMEDLRSQLAEAKMDQATRPKV
jgi:hypothetical protein